MTDNNASKYQKFAEFFTNRNTEMLSRDEEFLKEFQNFGKDDFDENGSNDDDEQEQLSDADETASVLAEVDSFLKKIAHEASLKAPQKPRVDDNDIRLRYTQNEPGQELSSIPLIPLTNADVRKQRMRANRDEEKSREKDKKPETKSRSKDHKKDPSSESRKYADDRRNVGFRNPDRKNADSESRSFKRYHPYDRHSSSQFRENDEYELNRPLDNIEKQKIAAMQFYKRFRGIMYCKTSTCCRYRGVNYRTNEIYEYCGLDCMLRNKNNYRSYHSEHHRF